MASNLDTLVTVFGGIGPFLGRHVVRALCKARLSNPDRGAGGPELAGHLQPIGKVGPDSRRPGQTCAIPRLRRSRDGAVPLSPSISWGILAEGGAQTFDAVQARGRRKRWPKGAQAAGRADGACLGDRRR